MVDRLSVKNKKKKSINRIILVSIVAVLAPLALFLFKNYSDYLKIRYGFSYDRVERINVEINRYFETYMKFPTKNELYEITKNNDAIFFEKKMLFFILDEIDIEYNEKLGVHLLLLSSTKRHTNNEVYPINQMSFIDFLVKQKTFGIQMPNYVLCNSFEFKFFNNGQPITDAKKVSELSTNIKNEIKEIPPLIFDESLDRFFYLKCIILRDGKVQIDVICGDTTVVDTKKIENTVQSHLKKQLLDFSIDRFYFPYIVYNYFLDKME